MAFTQQGRSLELCSYTLRIQIILWTFFKQAYLRISLDRSLRIGEARGTSSTHSASPAITHLSLSLKADLSDFNHTYVPSSGRSQGWGWWVRGDVGKNQGLRWLRAPNRQSFGNKAVKKLFLNQSWKRNAYEITIKHFNYCIRCFFFQKLRPIPIDFRGASLALLLHESTIIDMYHYRFRLSDGDAACYIHVEYNRSLS